MKRLNPVGSILGLILTSLLFIGLGFSIWHDRGLAFSPGQLTGKALEGVTIKGFSSHAEFEKNCSYCHEPFISTLADKCIDCHQDVREQLNGKTGVHGQIENINQCANCHPEHQGRDFDPTKASFLKFDHSMASFNLNWHQVNYDATPMQCAECHKDQGYSIVENQTCQDCHSKPDTNFMSNHLQENGASCLSCHDGKDRMKDFNHISTGFALEGKHTEVNCIGCHSSTDFRQTPQDCQQCHNEPVMHRGLFTQTCDTCHLAEGWSTTIIEGQSFNHLSTAGFSLALHQNDYAEQPINCTTCHPNNLQTFELQTCTDCHTTQDQQFMPDHQQQFGYDCLICHDGFDRLSNFDHAAFFPLDGKHLTTGCADCHANQVYRGTTVECWQCHAEPDIHKGVFGLTCNDCHSSDAWTPASLLKHDFPLNHGLDDKNMQLQCDVCHGTNYIEYTCSNCHEHQPDEIRQSHLEEGILAQDLPACAKCHPDGTVAEDE